jgi:hypothetical protein
LSHGPYRAGVDSRWGRQSWAMAAEPGSRWESMWRGCRWERVRSEAQLHLHRPLPCCHSTRRSSRLCAASLQDCRGWIWPSASRLSCVPNQHHHHVPATLDSRPQSSLLHRAFCGETRKIPETPPISRLFLSSIPRPTFCCSRDPVNTSLIAASTCQCHRWTLSSAKHALLPPSIVSRAFAAIGCFRACTRT